MARGWQVQLERGPRIDVPDDRLRRALDAARADLLLFPTGEDIVVWPDTAVPWTVAASVIEALDLFGFHVEAEELLAAVSDEQRLDGGIISADDALATNGAVLWALARHWELGRDDALIERLIGPIAKAGHWIDKRRRARRRSLLRDRHSGRCRVELAAACRPWRVCSRVSASPRWVRTSQTFADRLLADATRADLGDAGRVAVATRLGSRLLDRATPVGTWPEVAHPQTGGGQRGRGHDPAATAWCSRPSARCSCGSNRARWR